MLGLCEHDRVSRVAKIAAHTRIAWCLVAPSLVLQARMYRNQAIERTNHIAGPGDLTHDTEYGSDDEGSRTSAFSADNTGSDSDPTSHAVKKFLVQVNRAKVQEVCQ